MIRAPGNDECLLPGTVAWKRQKRSEVIAANNTVVAQLMGSVKRALSGGVTAGDRKSRRNM